MKLIIQSYGICDNQRKPLYNNMNAYISAHHIPDIMVVCRNGAHANEIA